MYGYIERVRILTTKVKCENITDSLFSFGQLVPLGRKRFRHLRHRDFALFTLNLIDVLAYKDLPTGARSDWHILEN